VHRLEHGGILPAKSGASNTSLRAGIGFMNIRIGGLANIVLNIQTLAATKMNHSSVFP
jgi:hypothetical protein